MTGTSDGGRSRHKQAEYSYSYGVGEDLDKLWILRYDHVHFNGSSEADELQTEYIVWEGELPCYGIFLVMGFAVFLAPIHYEVGKPLAAESEWRCHV